MIRSCYKMKKIIILVLVCITFSCKKRECSELERKVELASKEYRAASTNYQLNKSEENLKIADEKWSVYCNIVNDYQERRCYKKY